MTSELVYDPIIFFICSAAFVIGSLASFSGFFVVLRGQSFLGDVLSHSALPGLALSLLLFGTSQYATLTPFAAVSSLLAYFCIAKLRSLFRMSDDSSLAIVLSVFLSIGVLTSSFIHKSIPNHSVSAEALLFGNLTTIVFSDLLFALITFFFIFFFYFFIL